MICLPATILRRTLQVFGQCGRGAAECVAYWEGPARGATVDSVVHPGHARLRFGYVVLDAWLTGLAIRLAAERRSILAQVHTHPGEAFHSATDDEWPLVAQPGFISIVLPDYGAVRDLSDAAAFQLDANGVWQGCDPMSVIQVVR